MKSKFLILLPLVLTSCASMDKSMLLGAAIGGTTGALIGNSAGEGDRRDQSTLIGAAVGIGLGTLIGYSAHKSNQKKEQQLTNKTQFDPAAPSLTAPKVRRVWVPAKIEGDKYIEGHYMYVIEKTSSWSE